MIDGHFVVNSCDLVVLLVTILSTVKTRVISNEEDLCLVIGTNLMEYMAFRATFWHA